MSATTCFILTLSVTLFSIVVAGSCHAYTAGVKHPYQICFRPQFCCGSCSNRYCCSIPDLEFDDDDQDQCESPRNMSSDVSAVAGSVVGLVILITVIVSCCLCPCCCLYNMCRKPRPVATTHTTTVMQTAYVAPPAPVQTNQGGPYPGYQHVPIAAPGVQPMPPVQYPTQPYPPAGPPPYQDPGMAYPPPQAPYTQVGYSMGQPAYPLQPPAHTSYPPAPPVQMDYTSTQPAYNPAFVDPPKTGY
ncbi:protein shisa-5-like [Brienomyrus brachyistius]|uniref:protein shisa-5-like n=1 Tax=Brienomyrus brachyistius TaxID=42636 RepID=UPI0020B3FB47|nr:protein shisa-5-like [Brienomyrus brachyistius]